MATIDDIGPKGGWHGQPDLGDLIAGKSCDEIRDILLRRAEARRPLIEADADAGVTVDGERTIYVDVHDAGLGALLMALLAKIDALESDVAILKEAASRRGS